MSATVAGWQAAGFISRSVTRARHWTRWPGSILRAEGERGMRGALIAPRIPRSPSARRIEPGQRVQWRALVTDLEIKPAACQPATVADMTDQLASADPVADRFV